MNTTEYVLPLSCSCSNCDWNLCTMKTKISKDILICCCGENPRSKQLVYTCTTGSKKETTRPIKASETCCQPTDVQKSINVKDDKKYGKSESAKKNLKLFQKDKIDNKQEKKKSLKNEKVDCSCKGTQEKRSIFGTKAKSKVKKSDLYSKIEEIYKICCCELCNCPSPPTPQEKSSSDENEREAQKVCLCFDNHKEVSERNKGDAACECPMKSETFKPCLCDAINKGPESTTPIQLPPSSCGQNLVDKPSGTLSPKLGQPGSNSPRTSKDGLSSPKPDKQPKKLKNIMSPKLSCGQANNSCNAKQEKEVKIILPSQKEKNQPESGKDHYHDDHKEVDTEVKSNDFPICDCATPVESLSLICSCADSDISEDGFPTCACQPDDKKEEECPCDPGEIPTTNSDEITGTEEGMCDCTTCECIDCPNSRIKAETKLYKVKGGTRKTCKCTNCLMSTCRKDSKNCICKRKRTDPSKQRKHAPQTNKYDIHKTLLCENLPFNRTASEKICKADRLSAPCLFKDNNRKGGLCDCYLSKNNIHEYENILGEVDHCKCAPCECQFCTKSDNTGLGKNKACRCTKCECISCSNFCDNRKQDTDGANNKNLKYPRDFAKTDCNDILYENLTLLKRGEILSNFKTDKEQLVNDQLRFGLNKDLPLPYVVIDEKIQVINTNENKLVSKNSVKKNSKEKVKAHKNVTTRRRSNENSKEFINLLIPSNSGFIKRLTLLEPERMESKITNKEETVRNIKIYVQLKNICDNVDEYIKHLQNLLEKSKKDNENFESVVQKIKNETVPKVLELMKKENLKNQRMQLQ